ncbi:hypothetical protein HK102_013540 [Quaeritorhiza haematococci]|nr:hypothetical protein HK102_013540 [Quaeritorhiza haematococci]
MKSTTAPHPFLIRFMQSLNSSVITTMISTGHQLGLFDTMAELQQSKDDKGKGEGGEGASAAGAVGGMVGSQQKGTTQPAGTSEEIAKAAGLSERYVREWLNGMVVGKVINYDPSTQKYTLPADHIPFLSLKHGGVKTCVAQQAAMVTMFAGVEDKIMECFKKGGGLSYDQYPKFHQCMGQVSGSSLVPHLLEKVLPLEPGLVDRLRAGDMDVLEVGCGIGQPTTLMAETFPKSRFVGLDIEEPALAVARKTAEKKGLTNVRFIQQDNATLTTQNAYDLILSFDSIHDQGRPDLALAAIYRALKPGGIYIMDDVAAHSRVEDNLNHPLGPFLYGASAYHCMSVSLSQEGGLGLGACWGFEMMDKLLGEAGFEKENIRMVRMEQDSFNVYVVCRK